MALLLPVISEERRRCPTSGSWPWEKKNLEPAQNAKSDPIERIHARVMRLSVELRFNPTMTNPIRSDFSQTKVYTCILKI